MAIAQALADLKGHHFVLQQIARLFTSHRELIWELTKRDVRDRFAGQWLGAIWAIGHPILLMALYVFVFAYVFPARFQDSAGIQQDLSLYILAGLIPWLTFQDVLARSTTVISSNASLVKQIVFPIEVLPVKAVLASSLSQLVATGALISYALAKGALPYTALLLPVLFVCQLAAMSGVCYILSAIGVFFRDLKDIVQVFCAANLFLQPILFPPDLAPRVLKGIFYANPFSYVVWCYQDALFYGQIVHPIAWALLLLGSPTVFYIGYRLFRKMKIGFGDVL